MKKWLQTSTVVLSMIAVQAHAETRSYEIDPGHMFIQFKVPHLSYSYILGTFTDVSGSFDYDSETGEISKVSVTVKMQSIDTDHAKRDEHLREKEYLNTAEYDTATFQSTGWKDGKLTGKLSIYGNTQEITVPIKKIGEGDDPWGNYRSGFETHFTLKLADYGIPDKLTQEAEIYVTGEGIRQ